MNECVDFVKKKAVIIHQSDYSLTRLAAPDKNLGDLPATKNDKVNATEIARGFNIPDSDIIYIEDMPREDMEKVFEKVCRELNIYSKARQRTFLLVYAAGHGIADSVQFMVTNATSGNVFPIEDNLRSYCKGLKNYCTIFAIYDMCKSEKQGY